MDIRCKAHAKIKRAVDGCVPCMENELIFLRARIAELERKVEAAEGDMMGNTGIAYQKAYYVVRDKLIALRAERDERDARMKDVEKMRPIIRAELPPWVGLVDAEVDRIARAVIAKAKGE